jgi:hypothetical protein
MKIFSPLGGASISFGIRKLNKTAIKNVRTYQFKDSVKDDQITHEKNGKYEIC